MRNLVIFHLLLVIYFGQSHAAEAGAAANKVCKEPCASDGAWELSVGLGLGLSTNPLKGGSDIPLIVRPRLSYYGERVFLDNYEAGVMLWENPSQQINLFILPSLEQLYFRRWQYASGGFSLDPGLIKGEDAPEATQKEQPQLHHRHTSALGGFEYNATLEGFFDGLEINGQFLEELSGYHAGREIRLAISRDFLKYWRVSLGANFQNRDYINYYFGVTHKEAGPIFSEYSTKSGGWSKLVRLEYLKPISPHLAIRGGAALKTFSTAVANSPLLEESSVYSVFLGGVYYF